MASEYQDELRNIAKWLRELLPAADLDLLERNVQLLDNLRRMPDGENIAERFEVISDALERMADITFTPTLLMEKRVEEELCKTVATWMADPGHDLGEGASGLMAAIWWHARSTKTAAGKNLIASGLGGVAASIIGSAMRSKEGQGT